MGCRQLPFQPGATPPYPQWQPKEEMALCGGEGAEVGEGRVVGEGESTPTPLHPHSHPKATLWVSSKASSLGQDTALESSLSAFPGSGVCNILQQLFNIST